jgi:hypothetical protein
MKAIGFRAEPNQVHFAVIDSATPTECTTDRLRIGGGKATAEELALLRTAIVNVIEMYKPDVACVRTSDTPQSLRYVQSSFERARIEGVIMEASASKGVKTIAGPAVTIKAGMKTKTPLKAYAELDEVRGIDLSRRKNPALREAVYAALAGLGRG